MSTAILHELPEWLPESQDDMDSYSVPKGTDPDIIVLRWAWKMHEAKIREDALDTRIRELTQKKKAAQSTQDWCRRMMRDEMLLHGLATVKDEEYTISWRDTGERLDVQDESAVPRQFIDMVPKVRKADLTKAWKDTGEVPAGCVVTETDSSVVVRMK